MSDPGIDPDAAGEDGAVEADGGPATAPSTHTVRLELEDEPGELLSALRPIADRGGNLLSIYHERGNVTPRGRIPVEVDFECPPGRFDDIVTALREEDVNVMEAGTERYGEELVVLLIGQLVGTDLSDTLRRIEDDEVASVADVALSAPQGTDETATARLRLATRAGETDAALGTVRSIADEKGLTVIEPLTGAGGER